MAPKTCAIKLAIRESKLKSYRDATTQQLETLGLKKTSED